MFLRVRILSVHLKDWLNFNDCQYLRYTVYIENCIAPENSHADGTGVAFSGHDSIIPHHSFVSGVK